ncbi:hypothetical protein B0X71_14615 [Planococcus lenghuensis]|uniref:Transposase IS110-like N-terminal domain-containing protein n=1 Tax=Planococcus lenghuensis TaxID=2213202 RepID=A0A1Q2L193_9BACL|nr:hypothetical protein B0X71_14615 [Planococcus lenghuensis]
MNRPVITGYWLNLACFLNERGIPLVMWCNLMHVKRIKELDDNLQTKNDTKDALVITRLAKDGRYSHPRLPKETEADLRVGATLRGNLTDELSQIKNKLIRWIDRYFPEFRIVFPSFGKMALAALECTPFPSDVAAQEPEEVLALYRQVEGLKLPQKLKVKQLIEQAHDSIGLTEDQSMVRVEIRRFRKYRKPDGLKIFFWQPLDGLNH